MTYGYHLQETKRGWQLVLGSLLSGGDVLPQVSEMQPVGHWEMACGLVPEHSRPWWLRRWLMRVLVGAAWVGYYRGHVPPRPIPAPAPRKGAE